MRRSSRSTRVTHAVPWYKVGPSSCLNDDVVLSHGGRSCLNDDVVLSHGGRGLFAASDIPPDEIVCVFPEHCVYTTLGHGASLVADLGLVSDAQSSKEDYRDENGIFTSERKRSACRYQGI
jgi:hypothetical protein